MSVYAAQFVHDLNGDGCPEVVAVHGGDELSDPGNFNLLWEHSEMLNLESSAYC